MSLRPARLAGAVALALLLLDYAAWRIASARLINACQSWRAGLAAQGWQMQSDPPLAAGWPLRATIQLRNVQAGQGSLRWMAPLVTASITPLHPRRLALAASGMQSLDVPALGHQSFTARLIGSMPLGSGSNALRAPLLLEIRAEDLRLAWPAHGQVLLHDARMRLGWVPGAAHLVLTAGPAAYAAPGRHAPRPLLDTVALDLLARTAWPPGPARAAASLWRAAGGTLDLSSLTLRGGTLDVGASGRITLDADLQPSGSFAVRIADPDAALRSLSQSGAITAATATAATAVLDLIALPARLAGRTPRLDLPVSLQAGTFALGRIPMARIGRVAW